MNRPVQPLEMEGTGGQVAALYIPWLSGSKAPVCVRVSMPEWTLEVQIM